MRVVEEVTVRPETGAPVGGGRSNPVRWLFLALAALAVVAGIVLGPGPESLWDTVRGHVEAWQGWVGRHPLAALIAFFLVYSVATALPLPAVTVMSLLAGALFGRTLGTTVASLAYVTGVTISFLVARWALRDWVRRNSAGWLEKVERGIARDGAYYLLTLRLMPSIPFFLVNLLMAVMPIRTRTYVLLSWTGVLPITFLYAGVGRELAALESLSDILSWTVLASLAALAVAPLALRRFLRWWSRPS